MSVIISKEEIYNPKTNTQDVILEVTEGNAEILTNVVTIAGKLVRSTDKLGHIFNLGKKKDLQNKKAFINSVATDVSQNTNELIVNYEIKEDNNSTTYDPAKGTVDSQGNSITFIKSINFI